MAQGTIAAALAALALAALPTAAQARDGDSGLSAGGQCARFDILGNALRLTYRPFDTSAAGDAFDIRVDRLRRDTARVRFIFVDTTPGRDGLRVGSAGPERYDISWPDQVQQQLLTGPGGSPIGQFGAEVALPGREGRAVTRFVASVPAGQTAAGGQHVQSLLVRYQCLDASGQPVSGILEQPAAFDMIVTVPSFAAVYVGSIGQGRGSISFGTIDATADLSRTVPVITLATAPFLLDIDTDHDGVLRPGGSDARREAGIGYTMRLGSTAVADGDTLACPATPMPGGSTDLLEVTLDSDAVRRVPAGRYRDTITLTVTPRDIRSPGTSCQLRR